MSCLSSCAVDSALDVSNNNFASGSFPSDLTALTGLQSLSIANDGITGAIPDSISQLTSLLYGQKYFRAASHDGVARSNWSFVSLLCRALNMSGNTLSPNPISTIATMSWLTYVRLNLRNCRSLFVRSRHRSVETRWSRRELEACDRPLLLWPGPWICTRAASMETSPTPSLGLSA